MPRHRVPIPLRWADMDSYGHVNNVVFLQLMEEARVALLSRGPSGEREHGEEFGLGMLQTGIVVAHAEIEYLAPLNHRIAPMDVELWVTRIGAADFDLGYEIRDENTLYARAATTMVVYQLAEERPRRLTPRERTVLEAWRDAPVGFRRKRVAG
jgi:acyl-CoA thioester hydrolase